jgi:preprotein translocase subunit YajC
VNILFAMAPQGGDQGGGLMSTLIMFGAIFLIFYFMIIRPQQKRTKEREKLLSSIQKGDKVITNGGIHGVVSSVEEKTVILQVSDNTKLKFERSAITSVTSSKE